MKKLISCILTILLLLMSFAVPASAEFTENRIYKEKFLEMYPQGGGNPEYYELYVHSQSEDGADWALAYAHTFDEGFSQEYIKRYLIISDRVIIVNGMPEPFSSHYAIYDVKENVFTDLASVELEKYGDLEVVLDEINLGHMIGDAEKDNDLNILDVTKIQRCIAGLDEFHYLDDTLQGRSSLSNETLGYLSDMDRDGERSIMDATAIQQKLAKK